VVLKLLIARERRPEITRADENGLLDLVPTEEVLDGGHERHDRVAFLGLPDYACDRQILPHLNGLEPQFLGDDGSGDILMPFFTRLPDDVKIGGKTPDGRHRRNFLFRHCNILTNRVFFNDILDT
jgi:hypothetical protein